MGRTQEPLPIVAARRQRHRRSRPRGADPLLSLRTYSRTSQIADPCTRYAPPTFRWRPALHVDHGPVRVGQVNPAEPARLLDVPTTGSYLVGAVETADCGPSARGAIRGQLFGFVFKLSPATGAHRCWRTSSSGALRAQRRRQRRLMATEALERIGLVHRMKPTPDSSPAARSNGWPSPARSRHGRRFSSVTSRRQPGRRRRRCRAHRVA